MESKSVQKPTNYPQKPQIMQMDTIFSSGNSKEGGQILYLQQEFKRLLEIRKLFYIVKVCNTVEWNLHISRDLYLKAHFKREAHFISSIVNKTLQTLKQHSHFIT